MTIGSWIFTAVFGSFVELCVIGFVTDTFPPTLNVFNPIKNYKRWTSMNWFGVFFFTLVLNIVCPVLAFCYWFWKLCTVGRKG